MIKTPTLALEDELGDVLEKAIRGRRCAVEAIATQANVTIGRLRDALDYRSELSCAELERLAGVLRLNEVGLCALAAGRYPQPEIGPLPFTVWPLRMPHGIGVANAYLIGEPGSSRAVLFDTGAGISALEAVWPTGVRSLAAVFLTHVEGEHVGGLCEVVARFDAPEAFVPVGAQAPCGAPMGEGAKWCSGGLKVTAFATPGHSAAHSCYLVTLDARLPAVLISGDLVFAGSAGGGYFSPEELQTSLRRMLTLCPPCTVIAPGHGPLTTVENELRYNPFMV